MSTEYTVLFANQVFANQTFKLSRAQIEFDSPNFFTSYFDQFDQHPPRELELSRDPYLFTIILRYLNGYQILPLHPALVPPYCTLGTTLADLRADARFYHLDGLTDLLSSHENQANELTIQYAEVIGHYDTKPNLFEPTADFSIVVADFSLKLSSQQQYQVVSTQGNFRAAPTNRDSAGADRFYLSLLNERIVREVLQRDGYTTHVKRWEQLGWIRELPSNCRRRSTIVIKLWTEPTFKAD
ncbi:unnamed protein product [Rhizoctonia solani]|uniref:BTB domain-containing protein n=1 Tax=Rhizoctonia solani TaxID=456999 RepID=A0A8H3BD29_9AGAM|nr:unnamed protein product [Rhizoctonia solani]